MEKIKIAFDNQELTATLTDNSSAQALVEKLKQESLTIKMKDYANMEKVGPLGFSLPRNDKKLTTAAGDIILYQGDKLVIYYGKNSWSFTSLGKVDIAKPKELKKILGKGNITVTLSLA